ncbi:hypothetical protein K0A97_00920 [Patescibacteria group bacterium]|nr:hypothetical protein [Patescibacteria group bacterium]
MKIKLYHGSSRKLRVLKPSLAKGIGPFQNQKAIFLTKDFEQAALYSISKHLKGKTQFALPPKKLIIVGKFKLSKGYVYEIELNKKDVLKGDLKDYEFAYLKPIKKFKIYEIDPQNYKKQIILVGTPEEMTRLLNRK